MATSAPTKARKPGKGTKSIPRTGRAKVKRIAPAQGKRAAAAPPAGSRDIENIRGQLAKAETDLAQFGFTDADGIAKREQLVSDLRNQLEQAQLAAMTVPPEPSDSMRKVMRSDEERINVGDILVTDQTQAARMGDPLEIPRLARQIKSAAGLLHPIGVRTGKGTTSELIWGARRLAAVMLNGEQQITARVFPVETTDEQVAMLRGIENFGREDLTPVGRALEIAAMLDSIGRTIDGDSTAEAMALGQAVGAAGSREAYIGLLIGRPEDWVRDYSFVARLTGRARELLAARRLDLGHARELAKLSNPEAVDRIAQLAARDSHGLGGKPAAWVREQVLAETRDLSKVPWKLDVAFGADAKLGCEGWACSTCPYNAVTQPLLFGLPVLKTADGETQADDTTVGPVGICTNAPCFAAKQRATDKLIDVGIRRVSRELKARGDEAKFTKSELEQLAPDELRGEAFAREAKKRVGEGGVMIADADGTPLASGKGSTSGSSSKETSAPSPAKAFANKVTAWAEKAASAICTAIDAKPGRLLYFDAMRGANQLASMYRGDAKAETKARRVAASTPMKSLFKRWDKPELKDFLALEKQQISKAKTHRYDIERLAPEAMLALADALGVKLADAPMPETE